MVTFAKLERDGSTSEIKVIKNSDIQKCPFVIFAPEHYREDGSCKCDDPEHRKMMIREWGYKERHFKNIPLREE